MSETVTTRQIPGRIKVLIVEFVLFYVLWTCWSVFLVPAAESALGKTVLCETVKGCVKLLVWVLPAALLVRKFEPECVCGLKQMFTEKVPLKWVLLWTLLFFLLSSGVFWKGIWQGTLHIDPNFSADTHLWLLFVGITEEMMFRGWLLNATAKSASDWKMIALNALMFMSIHFPGWYRKGTLVTAFTSGGFLTLLLFSVLVSICFLKHRNLLLPVWLHMLYDFMLDFFAA